MSMAEDYIDDHEEADLIDDFDPDEDDEEFEDEDLDIPELDNEDTFKEE